MTEEITSRSILRAIDIELISILREKVLYPKNKDEFFLTLDSLSEEIYMTEKILQHSDRMFRSITDYYRTVDDKTIDLIIKNL